MIFIIILGLAALIWGLKSFSEYNSDFGDWVMTVLMSICIGLLGVMLGLIIAIGCGAIFPEKGNYVLKEKWQLECISDNGTVHGSFFLGSGNIDGEMCYVFYYQTDDKNTYALGQIDCDRSYIQYTDSIPEVEVYKYVTQSKKTYNWFCIDVTSHPSRYVFNIPKGSITNSFKLDAQ